MTEENPQKPAHAQSHTDLKTLLIFYAGLLLAVTGLFGIGLFLFYPSGLALALGKGTGRAIVDNLIAFALSFGMFGVGIILLALSWNRKFQNLRIMFLLLLVTGVLFLGWGAVDAIYPASPLSLSNARDGAFVSCSSFDGKAVPTVGDIFRCDITYKNFCNISNSLSLSIAMDYENLGNGDMVRGPTRCKNEDLVFEDIRRVIEKEGRGAVVFQLLNKQSRDPEYQERQLFIEFKAISQDAYDTRNNNRIQLLILVVTLGLFSTIAASRDFLEIWDGIDKKHNAVTVVGIEAGEGAAIAHDSLKKHGSLIVMLKNLFDDMLGGKSDSMMLEQAMDRGINLRQFKQLLMKMYHGFPNCLFAEGMINSIVISESVRLELIKEGILIREKHGNAFPYRLGPHGLEIVTSWIAEENIKQQGLITYTLFIFAFIQIGYVFIQVWAVSTLDPLFRWGILALLVLASVLYFYTIVSLIKFGRDQK